MRRLAAVLLVAMGFSGCIPALTEPQPELLTVQNRLRTFQLHVPDRAGTSPMPLLIVLHGRGGTGAEMQRVTELDEVADRQGFVVAYPDADPSAERQWALGCSRCTYADTLGIDDALFVRALVDHLASRLPIDRSRVYAVGFSLGGWFAFSLACRAPDLLAGIATAGANLPKPVSDLCGTELRAPAAILMGTADAAVPWSGWQSNGYEFLSGPQTAERWAQLNGCALPPAETPLPDRDGDGMESKLYTYENCRGGSEVRLYRLEGWPHLWPRTDISASWEIPAFLLRFSR